MTRELPRIDINMPSMESKNSRNRINSNNSEGESSSSGSNSTRDSPAITNLAQGEFFMDQQQQQHHHHQHHHHHHHQHHRHHNGAGSSASGSNGTGGRDSTPENRAASSRSPDPTRSSPSHSFHSSTSSSKMTRENNGSGKSNSSNGGGGGHRGANRKSGSHNNNSNKNGHTKDLLNVVSIAHASSTSSMDHRSPSPSLHNTNRHHQRMNRSKNNIHNNNNNNQHSNHGSNTHLGQNDNDNFGNNNDDNSENSSMQPSPDPSAIAMGRRRSSMPNVGDASFLAIPAEEPRGSKLRRVRSFKTTSKGAVVNRGDSFKKKSTHSLRSGVSNTAEARQQLLQQQLLLQHQLQLQNQLQQAAAAGGQEVADDPYAVEVTPSIPTYFRIIMMGGAGTGKSTLAKQFMTSDFVDNTDDNEGTQEMTVSVLLDGEESTIQVIDPVNRNVIEEGLDQILDAYVVVFAINDHSSFQAVQELVRYLRVEVGVDRVMLLVGNKTDLVRKRKVTAEEARLVAETYDCKYTETSASLNHGVDELLVGVLTQIRLHMRIPFTTIVFPGKGQPQDDRENRRTCKGPRKFFSRLFRRSGRKKLRECENLHAL